MKVLLTGGGTLGSVTPLLAVVTDLHPEATYWIGTMRGVERSFIEKEGIRFFPIVSGKLRRYFDWRTLIVPFFIGVGFAHALILLVRLRPSCIIGAGGYVQVPVIFAGWLLRIPSYIIQLDYRAGLSNRLVVPLAQKVFVVFDDTARAFPQAKTLVVGSCVRPVFRNGVVQGKDRRPLLLVLGGGTGASSLNAILWEAVSRLTVLCDVAHVTGAGKGRVATLPHYTSYELLTDALPTFIAWADVVVTRAGMGTLSELAAQAKPAIVVPLPNTSQGENAALLAKNDAAVVIEQKSFTPDKLVAIVTELLSDSRRRTVLGENLQRCIPTDGAQKIARIIRQ